MRVRDLRVEDVEEGLGLGLGRCSEVVEEGLGLAWYVVGSLKKGRA